jgi:hypothetical protein
MTIPQFTIANSIFVILCEVKPSFCALRLRAAQAIASGSVAESRKLKD